MKTTARGPRISIAAHDYTLGRRVRAAAASRDLQAVPAVHRQYLDLGGICRCQSAKLRRGLPGARRRQGRPRGGDGAQHVGHVLHAVRAARLGAIMVPVNPEFGAQEARYVLQSRRGERRHRDGRDRCRSSGRRCRDTSPRRGSCCSTAATTRLHRSSACCRRRTARVRQRRAPTTPASSSTPRAPPAFPRA